MNPAGAKNPRAKITEVSDRLTTSERRVVMALLSNYPEAGLDTVATLAALAKVSSPTIIRFIRKLGFDNYSEFQRSLQRELGEFNVSPPELLSQDMNGSRKTRRDLLAGFDRLETELNAAAQKLAQPKAAIYAIGGIWSQPAAQHFTNSMQRVRSHCSLLTTETLPPAIVDANRHSVFVVFDFRQYTPELFKGMQLAHEKNATVMLVTDRWVSPIAAVSKIMLPVDIDYPPFDSLIAPLAVTEDLAERVRHRIGPVQDERITKLYRVYEAVGAMPQ